MRKFIGILFCLAACQSKYDGFHKTSKGLYRKVFVIGDEQIQPVRGSIVRYNLTIRDQNKQIKSVHKNAFLQLNGQDHFFSKIFLELYQGDSVCYIKPDNNQEDDLYYYIKLEKVFSSQQQRLAYQDFVLRSERKELASIQKFISSDTSSYHKILGLYIDKPDSVYRKQRKKGDQLTIKYTGRFLNGEVFESTKMLEKGFQFNYGDPGQVIKGIEIALSMMRAGEKSKIILPSYLGYGEQGSSSGIVPPYTAITYEIELVDVQ